MNPNETEMRELDAWIWTHVFKYRFWKERRGEYELCVFKRDGKGNPWDDYRDSESKKPRYTECTAAEAIKTGFYGKTPERATTDSLTAFEVLKRCVEKANNSSLHICEREGIWIVQAGISSGGQPTLETAICRFAFQLYGGKTT